MKTIFDAVNELQGELTGAVYANHHKKNCKKVDVFLHKVVTNEFDPSPVGSYVIYSCDESDRGDVEFICTTGEFNALVAEMETNFGKSDSYCSYLVSSCTQVVSHSVIDWGDAPESATHYYNKKYWKVVNGILFVWTTKQPNGSFDIEWHWSRTDYIEELTEKMTPRLAKQKRIYTQEMHDNGELPPIGSMFIDVELSNEEQVEAMAHDLELGRVIYKRGSTLQDSEYFGEHAHECKPTTPKLELIDGECYQFEYIGNTSKGYYSKDKDQLHFNGGWARSTKVDNIKPLTVND